MIFGIGVDVVSVARIEKIHRRWGERFERRVLAKKERSALPKQPKARLRRIALAFAAKEAFAKALGTGFRWPASLHQIAVDRNSLGAPGFKPGPALAAELAARKVSAVHLSLSDECGSVVAMAVMEQDG